MTWCLIKHRDNFIFYLGAGIVNGYWKDAEGSNAMQGSEFLSFPSHSDGLSNSLRQF
jgi:hypothetical protein